jgi:hypothetical protein
MLLGSIVDLIQQSLVELLQCGIVLGLTGERFRPYNGHANEAAVEETFRNKRVESAVRRIGT